VDDGAGSKLDDQPNNRKEVNMKLMSTETKVYVNPTEEGEHVYLAIERNKPFNHWLDAELTPEEARTIAARLQKAADAVESGERKAAFLADLEWEKEHPEEDDEDEDEAA
jgi:hypothetical protein